MKAALLANRSEMEIKRGKVQVKRPNCILKSLSSKHFKGITCNSPIDPSANLKGEEGGKKKSPSSLRYLEMEIEMGKEN